jgi:hypothetical protein
VTAIDEMAESLTARAAAPHGLAWQALADQVLAMEIDDAPTDEAKNRLWFLRQYVAMVRAYVAAFEEMRDRRYYPAWCQLEQVEIGLKALLTNRFYDPSRFDVPGLVSRIAAWQELFPYGVFISPGMRVRRATCSICGAANTIDIHCGHRPGRVYAGRFCARRLEEVELREVSVVLKPVQKYSVLFADVDNPDRYTLVGSVVEMVGEPFAHWRAHWTFAYHPHRLFAHVPPSGPCPCGGGGLYETCCAPRPGVRRPHLDIELERPPPADRRGARLHGYSEEQLARLENAGASLP